VVTNQGPGSATALQLTDQLSTSVRFESVTSTAGSCSEADGIVTCSLGDIPNGATVTVMINVTARRTGTATNTAQVSSISPDSNPANNADTEETVITR
ncbi:MAG TPA: DUF11 domain-containing protein, partial [Anaerolineales bacterium]|nr:DUF11 domain-containing protein [Anaerolineales bacterium]